MNLQDRLCPTSNNVGLRRPSRSPRSQRSRSADVDCLKKYTERRVEERRHTEVTDPSKLDTSKWLPLPRNVPRGQQSMANKRFSRDERQDSSEEPAAGNVRWPPEPVTVINGRSVRIGSETVGRQPAGRSLSADVTTLRVEKRIVDQRRHTDCSDPRTIAIRLLPQINGGKFRRESSPLARVDCESTKTASNRWMTFAKNSSPDPMPRASLERADSTTAEGKDEGSPKDADNVKWQPSRKFSPTKGEKKRLQRQDELDIGRDRSASFVEAANERANKLTQRMRDLYDFKTENEWPKRANPSPHEHAWISKSSSEEERTNYQPVRRNSQELEFNDRIDMFKFREEEARREEDRQREQREKHDAQDEVFTESREERLRKFHDKLKYCENNRPLERTQGRQRRTYSDDYEEKARRESHLSRQSDSFVSKKDRSEPPTKRLEKENKRNFEAISKIRESRVSYAEVDFLKKNSRAGDANYTGVNFSKAGSIECKSTRQILEVPPRRAFSQTDERPSTPIPPIEWNDERYVPKKLSPDHQKRDSTRYKVYLT